MNRTIRAIDHGLRWLGGLTLAATLMGTAAASIDVEDSGEDSAAIEEVVVTAQFRETSLQDTPLAITALSQEALDARGITGLVGVGASVPNVTLRQANAAYGATLQAFIRGIGQRDYNFAFEPGVGVYVDEAYHATTFGALWDLLDLERVEVLRGPQGTRFGKNSIGGAIVLVTRKPRGDHSGYFEAGVGEFDRIRWRGAYDLPIVEDELALRVSALSDRADGFQERIDFACDRPDLAGNLPSEAPGRTTGDCRVGRFGGRDVQAARAALRWTPSPRWVVDLTGDVMDDDSEAAANKLLAIGDPAGNFNTVPDTATGLPPLIGALWNPNENVPAFGIPFDARFLDPDPFRTYGTYRDLIRGFDTGRKSTVEAWGLSAVVSLQLRERFSLESITVLRRYEGRFSHDPDQSPLALQNVQNEVGNRQFSQELRVRGASAGDRLFLTAGLYWLDVENTLQGLVHLPPIPGTFFGALGFYQDDIVTTKNASAYTHLEWEASDSIQLFGGLRYTDERKRYAFDHSPELTIPEPAGEPFDRWDWRAGVKVRLGEGVMVYGSGATGFRSGGVNPRPFSDAQFIPFGPEDVTSWELGAKLALADDRLRLDLAVFTTDFDNRIQSQQTVDLDGNPLTAPTNLGTGEINGYEAELQWAPFEGLLINAMTGLAEFETDDEAFLGERPVDVPDRTAAAGIEYRFAVPGTSVFVTPRLDWWYQSRIDYAVDNDPVAATPSRELLDGRLEVAWPGRWSASLMIRNLTDERYYVQKFTLIPFGLGTLEGQPGMPRTWMLSLRKDF